MKNYLHNIAGYCRNSGKSINCRKEFMDKVYFSLDTRDDNRLTRIFKIILGILCIAIAIYWLVFNLLAVKQSGTQWITVAFLVGFGAYQIYAGLGYAGIFIELFSEKIRLKKNPILPLKDIPADLIEKIELFPLNVVFFLKSGGKNRLRFGISDPDKIEDIKKRIIEFADANGLRLEIMREEI